MYKTTAASGQFFTRSGSFSTHGGRTGADFLGQGDPEFLSMQQRHEALSAAYRRNVTQIMALNAELKNKLPYKLAETKKAERQQVVEKIERIKVELAEVKRELSNREPLPDLGECIISIVKERMTRPEWELLVKSAMERYTMAREPKENK